jgi:hypothetical protein
MRAHENAWARKRLLLLEEGRILEFIQQTPKMLETITRSPHLLRDEVWLQERIKAWRKKLRKSIEESATMAVWVKTDNMVKYQKRNGFPNGVYKGFTRTLERPISSRSLN